MITVEDYLWFVDEALDQLVAVLATLGDDLANTTPDLPGANSPYAIVTHCLGVMEQWGGEVIAARAILRDRPSEFTASGHVEELVGRLREARVQLALDLAAVDGLATPRGPVDADDAATPLGRTQGGVLLHIYEELSQHLGQLEITRDLLLST